MAKFTMTAKTRINRLPEREKTVLVLYYFEGMTLNQIGQVLGVTESRVSQMHTKAVLGLRGGPRAPAARRPSTDEKMLPVRSASMSPCASWAVMSEA